MTGLEASRRLLAGFGLHLRRCRQHKQLSTRALGELLGISPSIITRIEGGKWMPTAEMEHTLREWMVHQPLPHNEGPV